ncbi:MAG: NAD(P)/FAD-dependent oxidoreductase [Bacteroidales bacterium]|nr:NAD(P)/FAD-dependent oxidoreductase [Bacteroidales bacterium]
MEKQYDVIIIGGGLGGLTAGAKLAKEGKKVLLIEQHLIPGGCATTFRRKDFRFEVGLHEMDGLHKADMKTRVFRDLGVFDHVEFLRVPEFFRFIHKDTDIVVPHNPEEAKAILKKHFPEEGQGIDSFFDRLLNARRYLKTEADQPEISIGEYLDKIIDTDELKLILLGNLGYFGDDPYALSLNYYAIAEGSYYEGGGNFIKGGSQNLSDYLAGMITGNGGEVLLRHKAEKILVEEGKAVGVAYHKKNSEEMLEARASHIIANASVPTVVNQMLPGEVTAELKEQLRQREVGASLLTIYFGFNKSVKELGFNNYSVFVFDDSIDTPHDIINNNHADFSTRSFTFVDYGQLDSGLAPEGKSVGVICTIDYAKDWESLSREEYKTKKEEVAREFITRLEKLIPGVKEHIEYYEVGTSKTVERFTLNPEGAVYGFSQTPERVRLDPLKPIENLYFASAWTKVGGGFTGAIMNGYLSAYEIIRKG